MGTYKILIATSLSTRSFSEKKREKKCNAIALHERLYTIRACKLWWTTTARRWKRGSRCYINSRHILANTLTVSPPRPNKKIFPRFPARVPAYSSVWFIRYTKEFNSPEPVSEIPLQVRERQTDFTGRMREIKIILQRLHGIITYRLWRIFSWNNFRNHFRPCISTFLFPFSSFFSFL